MYTNLKKGMRATMPTVNGKQVTIPHMEVYLINWLLSAHSLYVYSLYHIDLLHAIVRLPCHT